MTATEITPTIACRQCGAATCVRCLGCASCDTYAVGCVCPADEPPLRTAYLIAKHNHRAHREVCFACSWAQTPDCQDGRELRAEANAAWRALSEGWNG